MDKEEEGETKMKPEYSCRPERETQKQRKGQRERAVSKEEEEGTGKRPGYACRSVTLQAKRSRILIYHLLKTTPDERLPKLVKICCAAAAGQKHL